MMKTWPSISANEDTTNFNFVLILNPKAVMFYSSEIISLQQFLQRYYLINNNPCSKAFSDNFFAGLCTWHVCSCLCGSVQKAPFSLPRCHGLGPASEAPYSHHAATHLPTPSQWVGKQEMSQKAQESRESTGRTHSPVMAAGEKQTWLEEKTIHLI